MRHHVRRLAAVLALLLAATGARASNEDAGFGARSAGMGDALTADTNGLAGLTLNPATLGHLRRAQVEMGIRRLYHAPAGSTDLNGMVLGAGIPLTNPSFRGTLGLSWTHDILRPISLDRTLGLTYATRSWREIGPGWFDVGATFRMLQRGGRDVSGSITKVGVDLGAYYGWGEDKGLGLSLLNLNSPPTDIGGYSDTAPLIFKLGYVQRLRRFAVAMDFTKREPSAAFEASNSVALGVEHAWGTAKFGTLTGRSGLALGSPARTWNLGFGWSVFGTRLDYALRVPLSGGPRWGHSVSLSYRFGTWDPEGEYERLLKTEMRYRRDLSKALESAEIKQWRLAEELRLMRREIADLRRELAVKEAETGEAQDRLQDAKRKLKLKALEDKRRKAAERLRRMKEEQRRMREANKSLQFRKEWRAYTEIKLQGVSELVLIERLKRILREFQGTGVDLGEANRELRRLMRR